MKYIYLLLISILCIACKDSKTKEVENTTDSKPVEKKQASLKDVSSDTYSTLFKDYKCEFSIDEIAKLLNVPSADLEMPSNLNQGKSCVLRYSRNGTYESNLTIGSVPSSKKGNVKAITKALQYKEDGVSILGSDIIVAETKDCYLLRTPVNGRITIRSVNHDGAFQLFYGPKGKRTKEQHEEMKIKMTSMANHLLKKHR